MEWTGHSGIIYGHARAPRNLPFPFFSVKIPMKNITIWHVVGTLLTRCVVCEGECTKATSYQLRAFIWIWRLCEAAAMVISFIIVIVISPKMYPQRNPFHKPIILFRMTAEQFLMYTVFGVLAFLA